MQSVKGVGGGGSAFLVLCISICFFFVFFGGINSRKEGFL